MHEYSIETQIVIHQLLAMGLSTREVVEVMGIARGTVLRYRKIAIAAGSILKCRCGKLAGHKGWCPPKYAESEKRHKVMAAMILRRVLRSQPELFVELPGDYWALVERGKA